MARKNFKSVKNILTNVLLVKGLKEKSEKLLFKTAKSIQRIIRKNFGEVIQLFVMNSLFLISSRKTSFSQKIIPFFLKKDRRVFFSLKKILEKRSKNFGEDIVKISRKKGALFESKNEFQHVISKNKKLAHYRWF